jgi:hypothetical protein
MSNTPEDIFKEREKRIADAIALRTPDRVPIVLDFGALEGRYSGFTQKEMMSDREKHFAANWKANIDFAPDLANPVLFIGPMLEALDCKLLKWAGHGLEADLMFQYVEGEYMKAEEYDAFLFDPSDFVVRTLWPRIFGKLGIFGSLPALSTITGYVEGALSFMPFAHPDGLEALEAIRKAAEEAAKTISGLMAHGQRLAASGFPLFYGAVVTTPFDMIGDMLRGTKGVMIDMYRRPDKVIRACEKLLPIKIGQAVNGARMSGNPRVFIPLHKGAEGFMSLDQFKRFYWPTLKGLLEGLVNEGLTPVVVVEGKYISRLDVIKDVPEGKIVYWFEDVDMGLAKEILGDRVCIMGNVPASTMVTGTPDDVRDRCKRLIDKAGKGGGYIMSTAARMDDVSFENAKTLIEFTKEYGVY